ncbi:MAG TPA: S8 family serine peptidase, partial [Pyrinomonadaceae bacterium]|nr:S8 family serine peptidase [Pyrinomonadaceae bacterium]
IAIARPSGAFGAAANAIAAKGAAAVILIRPDMAKITVGQTLVPTWSILESDARYLLDLLASNDPVGVDPAKGALSEYPIRIRQGAFSPAMAAFSSRGPVGGYGQVKPDVTAPGVGILSATVRVGGVAVSTAPGFSYMFNPTGYTSASGTSFSSPITAGIAALIKQKNPNWTPAMIRAALVNTATNLRQPDGTPLADGANSVNEQGGGLVDARRAANAKALMGAGGPGAAPSSAPPVRPFAVGVGPLVGTSPGNPEFSATYSFGSVEIAGVEGTASETAVVNIYDVTGAGGGDYRLSVADSRGVDGTNFRVELVDGGGSPVETVEVPFEGAAAFRVRVVASGEAIADGAQFQFYVTATRADNGQTLRMPFYFRAHKPAVTTSAPNFAGIQGTEVAEATPLDVDGSYRLQYAAPASGTPEQYRIEESADNGATWAKLADVPASTLAYDIAGRGNGNYQYRVTGLFPVRHGYVAGPPSAARAVRVDRRHEADVTSLIETVNASVVYGSGFAEIDQALRNKSTGTTLYPPARFVITSINSASGAVRVANADNQGDGVGAEAAFDYTSQVGPDLAPGETSATRRLRFNNPNSELFTFTAVVRAHLPDAAGGSSSTSGGGSGGGGTEPVGGTGDAGPGSGGGSLGSGTTQVLRFTVNPLLRKVTVQIIR